MGRTLYAAPQADDRAPREEAEHHARLGHHAHERHIVTDRAAVGVDRVVDGKRGVVEPPPSWSRMVSNVPPVWLNNAAVPAWKHMSTSLAVIVPPDCVTPRCRPYSPDGQSGSGHLRGAAHRQAAFVPHTDGDGIGRQSAAGREKARFRQRASCTTPTSN